MSIPISESILTHTAVLLPATTTEDDYGSPVADTSVTLTKIRISRAKRIVLNSLGEQKEDKLVLIFDKFYSLPAGTTFKAGDQITYRDSKYRVREIEDPSGDQEAAHYYRVMLTGL
jgi:hypothetical protein